MTGIPCQNGRAGEGSARASGSDPPLLAVAHSADQQRPRERG
ncbi:hypothetical protein AB0B06_34400 [Streptomyces sp. NPDC044989]